ncbi:MAG: SUMF1/EgtB/PvdO family nonheme iron enzyme, partial [Treponema sp.]|nr:SUMF1/EgtB/PvdO family nonheme iron enzyme [Treponema sp.]
MKKKHLLSVWCRGGVLIACALSLLLVSCGGGGSDDDDTPVLDFVAVPGATFDGTTAITGSSVFIANRTVTIPNLLVCVHEVTQAEYQSVMGANPSYFSGANKPVEGVNWYDALVYCNRRSIAEQRMPCYT